MRNRIFTFCLILIVASLRLDAKPKAHFPASDPRTIHFSSAALEKAYYQYIRKPAVSARSTDATLSRLTGRRTDNVDSGVVTPFDSSNLSYSGDRGGDDNGQLYHQDFDQQTTLYYVGNAWDDTARTLQSFDSNNNIDTSIVQTHSNGAFVNSTMSISTYDNDSHQTSFTSYYWSNNAWIPGTKYVYSYNAQGFLLLNVVYTYSADTFVYYASDSLTYDGNNRLIRMVEDLASNDSLVYNNLTVYTYDNSGNKIYDAGYNWTDTGWLYTYRDSNTYNAANNPLTELNQSYYPLSVGWFDNYLHIYTYDAHQNNLTYIEDIWDDSLVPDYEQVLTYNANNDTLTGVYFALYNDGVFDTSDKVIYSYTYNGNAVAGYTVLDSAWDSTGVYSNYSLNTYNYDDNGNIIVYESQLWNGTGWGMPGDLKTVFLFNSYNQYVTENDSTWGTTSWEGSDNKYWWYQAYEGISTVADAPASSVAPNPFTNKFTVTFNAGNEGQAILNLYDLNGRLLTTKITNAVSGSNTITYDGGYTLPAGTYIYEVRQDNTVSRGKVVCEPGD